MNLKKIEIDGSKLLGNYIAPPSKSHTFRALILAFHAKKASIIDPLISSDTKVLIDLFKIMGAEVEFKNNILNIEFKNDITFPKIYNFQNSGTALRFFTPIPPLFLKKMVLDGDNQLRKRKNIDLLNSLKMMGAKYNILNDKEIPFEIFGELNKNITSISSTSSQYLSSLLLNLPFKKSDTEIVVDSISEKPYIDITTYWLDKLNVKYKNFNYKKFYIFGDQKIFPFTEKIAKDFSSASFLILASILSNSEIVIKGLDKNDTQGDKKLLKYLKYLGCKIKWEKDNSLQVFGKPKMGGEFDFNDTPDLLPPFSIFLSHFNYNFKIFNCESCRYKESDRIDGVYKILSRMGLQVRQFKDGIEFKGDSLRWGKKEFSAFNDHRFIMSLPLLSIRNGKIIINDIGNINSSYPNFFDILNQMGFFVKIM